MIRHAGYNSSIPWKLDCVPDRQGIVADNPCVSLPTSIYRAMNNVNTSTSDLITLAHQMGISTWLFYYRSVPLLEKMLNSGVLQNFFRIGGSGLALVYSREMVQLDKPGYWNSKPIIPSDDIWKSIKPGDFVVTNNWGALTHISLVVGWGRPEDYERRHPVYKPLYSTYASIQGDPSGYVPYVVDRGLGGPTDDAARGPRPFHVPTIYAASSYEIWVSSTLTP
ncbi:MAG: hypothetical protein ACYDBJ_20770 [Aggregatilineales bacterium]